MSQFLCPVCQATINLHRDDGWALVFSKILVHLEQCDRLCTNQCRERCAAEIADRVTGRRQVHPPDFACPFDVAVTLVANRHP